MPETDSHVDMSASDFRLRLMKAGLERAHLFWDGPSVLDLDTLGVQRLRKESDRVVHLFDLARKLLCHCDHCLVCAAVLG